MIEGRSRLRNSYLIEGRRVAIRDLLDAELLAPDQKLVLERPRSKEIHHGIVRADGRIELSDGRSFGTPSSAARSAARVSLDGWIAWRLADSDSTLDDLRQQLIEMALAEPKSNPASGALSFLKEARTLANEGRPLQLTVRQLLTHWGADERTDDVANRIEQALDDFGLATSPDFLKVRMNIPIRVVPRNPTTNPTAPFPATDMTLSDSKEDRDDVDALEDIGLTLGNIASMDREVETIRPDSTIEEAITRMLLNDYSQLAVASGPRSLMGAISWKSISCARQRSSAVTANDALVHAELIRYDRDLVEALPALLSTGFAFVSDDSGALAGIVTTSDLVLAYRDLATPFFLIGELDRLLRKAIADNVPLARVRELCDPNNRRSLDSFGKLTMGDYERVLENTGSWQAVGWPLERKAFRERLAKLRAVRNSVMHFSRDPIHEEAVDQLRYMIQTIRLHI